MDFLVDHPGVALIAVALGLIVAGAILRRVVFIVAAVALVAAFSMVFPGPRALAGEVIAGDSISGRASCAFAGVSSWDVLTGKIPPASLTECESGAPDAPAKPNGKKKSGRGA